MGKSNVFEFQGRDTIADLLTELLGTGAEQLVYQAVEAELQELLAELYSQVNCMQGNFSPQVIVSQDRDGELSLKYH